MLDVGDLDPVAMTPCTNPSDLLLRIASMKQLTRLGERCLPTHRVLGAYASERMIAFSPQRSCTNCTAYESSRVHSTTRSNLVSMKHEHHCLNYLRQTLLCYHIL
jgi:hypothetical protein